MKALVLCAGYGTRLGSLTRRVPKPMLPLVGRPLLAYILGYLRKQGIEEVALNLHFRPESIRNYFGDGSDFGLSLTYSEEPDLLGTAGALTRLRAFFADEEAFLVLYGDIITDQDLASMLRFHRENKALATLVLHRRAGSNSRVTMSADGRITAFEERPADALPDQVTWVNSGIQLLSQEVLDLIPPVSPADLPRDVYVPNVKTGRLFGFPLTGFRIAVDSPQRYRDAETALKNGLLAI